jgi:hypothetical protein
MSLFQCSKCGCAEDTALCHYWSARLHDTAPMCSGCDPKIAKWHGEFERVPPQLRLKREMEQWLGMSLDIPDSTLPHFSAGSDETIRSLISDLQLQEQGPQ